MPENEPQNPVHMHSSASTRWTTVNFGEAMQGVQKPLSWGFWSPSMEGSTRRTFTAMGVLPMSELPVPTSPDLRLSGIFYGRVAGNVETFRRVGDRMPGSSGDALDEKFFGHPPDGAAQRKPASAYRRYPVVAVKLPLAARRAARELPGLRAEMRQWWQRNVLDASPEGPDAARVLLGEAAKRYIDVGEHHALVSILASSLLDELGALAERATGDASLAMQLATGYGSMEETELIDDLLAASRGELELDALLRRHGYHGPLEGDLSTHVWREDTEPLEAILRSYRTQEMVGPHEREREQRKLRAAAEARLLAGLPAVRRPGARLVIKLASTYIPLREVGKAGFLHAVDAARCAARVIGDALARDGALADPEDVFFLTLDEALSPNPEDFHERVEIRRESHARYLQLTVPPRWSGNPEPIPVDGEARANGSGERPAQVKGIGVAGERVTGRARVVFDPSDADLETGDILVCKTTDPSWTPLFMLADAVVIDTGGAVSHGAIVARELGMTCVINTVTGTRDIPDGATLTVDGTTGVVEIAG